MAEGLLITMRVLVLSTIFLCTHYAVLVANPVTTSTTPIMSTGQVSQYLDFNITTWTNWLPGFVMDVGGVFHIILIVALVLLLLFTCHCLKSLFCCGLLVFL